MPAKGHRKPPPVRRSTQMSFWVTPAERDRIAENAERAGVSISAYIRSLALGRPLKVKPSIKSAELIRQLSKLANNLNQLLEHAESGRIDCVDNIRHVRGRVFDVLTAWSDGKAQGGIASEDVAVLTHEGTTLNSLARQANSRKPVPADALLNVLHSLTGALRPFQR